MSVASLHRDTHCFEMENYSKKSRLRLCFHFLLAAYYHDDHDGIDDDDDDDYAAVVAAAVDSLERKRSA
jgi:hypothetical protein